MSRRWISRTSWAWRPMQRFRSTKAPTSTAALLDIYQAIANDNASQVVSTSWGLCEAGASSSFLNSENTIFQQMASQGQTVFAAAGDAGSADCDSNPPPNAAPNSPSGLAVPTTRRANRLLPAWVAPT